MKVGIIGGGFGLKVQAPIINSYEKMDLIAVSTMHRHQLPEELGSLNHYKNWMEMLDNEELDLVFVSSMPIHHYEMVKYAMKKEIHVVCEKPFTVNSKQSEELLMLAHQSNVKVLIDFEWRYIPARQKVKSLLNEKIIGDLIHLEYHISNSRYQHLLSNQRGWLGQRENFGGMLGALGSHMIDCLRWLIGDEIKKLSGFVHTHVPIGAGEVRDADDAFFIHGIMNDNTTFSLQFLSGVNHGFGSSLKVFGSEGTITLTNDNVLCVGTVNEQLQEIHVQQPKIPDELPTPAKRYYPAFSPFLEKVYEYVVCNKLDDDLATVTDAHENQKVIDEIIANKWR